MDLIPSHSILSFLLAGLTVLGLLFLFWHSTIRRDAYFSIPLLLALFALNAGIMFHILHWPWGTALLMGSGILLILTYSWWFWRKPRKARLDYLKLIWIAGLGLTVLLLGAGLRGPLPYVSGVTTLAFWAMLLDFVYVTYLRRNTEAKPPIS
jgi:hypothetical protein